MEVARQCYGGNWLSVSLPGGNTWLLVKCWSVCVCCFCPVKTDLLTFKLTLFPLGEAPMAAGPP
jgi:hypothetical protein